MKSNTDHSKRNSQRVRNRGELPQLVKNSYKKSGARNSVVRLAMLSHQGNNVLALRWQGQG